jgi:hypothetical protein
MQYLVKKFLDRRKEGRRICRCRGHSFLKPRFPADILCIATSQHASHGKRTDKIPLILPEYCSQVLGRSGGIRRCQLVHRTGNDLTFLEAVVPERFYNFELFVSQDHIPFIEKFYDEPVGGGTFADIEDKDAFQSVLVDCQHLPAGQVLAQEHRVLGRVFRGIGKLFYEVSSPAGLDK